MIRQLIVFGASGVGSHVLQVHEHSKAALLTQSDREEKNSLWRYKETL